VRHEDFIYLLPHRGEVVIRCRHILVVVHLINLVKKLGRDQILQKHREEPMSNQERVDVPHLRVDLGKVDSISLKHLLQNLVILKGPRSHI